MIQSVPRRGWFFLLGGYIGRILWINLSNGKVQTEPLEESLIRDYVGGYGLGARLLYNGLKPGADPLGEENILGFCSGPLTGTPAIEGNRFMVVCKSPLTGGWGDANCGGSFGPSMKFAGADAIFFEGRAKTPMYLFVSNREAALLDATRLWGMDTGKTEKYLKDRHGRDSRVACIGPAGENLCLISAVIHEGRAAARSGVGAAMGSKNLKAVVVRGQMEVPLADADFVKTLRKKYMKCPSREYKPLSEAGTIGILGNSIMSGDAPVKNWKGSGPTDFPQGIGNFSKERVMTYQTKRIGCWNCTIACSGKMKVKEGRYAFEGKKVEYESAAAFGPLIMNDNFEAILCLNDLCNKLGFDTISTGSAIAFAMECSENNLFTDDDLRIRWGDAEKAIQLLPKMAKREGAAAVLSDGVRKASESIGPRSHEFAVHVNGQELPFHDPRFQPGMATTYAVEPTPGRHCPCEWILPPGLDFPDDFQRYSPHDKGLWQKRMTCQMQVVNASGICQFAYYSYPLTAWPEFLQAVTGMEYDVKEFERTGERILNLRHAFNLREGLNPREFMFPGRALGKPPLKEGNTRGITVDLDTQVAEYFQALDWDRETSYPSFRRLQELGLDFVIEDLYT